MPGHPEHANGLPSRRIHEVARELGLDLEAILPHGHHIAKIPIAELEARRHQPDGQLILVSAMTPTPQGEGKTTTTIGLGGPTHGVPRRDGFNITPASEIMAILCLAKDYRDLGQRMANMVVGFTHRGEPVRAEQMQAVGAMQRKFH